MKKDKTVKKNYSLENRPITRKRVMISFDKDKLAYFKKKAVKLCRGNLSKLVDEALTSFLQN